MSQQTQKIQPVSPCSGCGERDRFGVSDYSVARARFSCRGCGFEFVSFTRSIAAAARSAGVPLTKYASGIESEVTSERARILSTPAPAGGRSSGRAGGEDFLEKAKRLATQNGTTIAAELRSLAIAEPQLYQDYKVKSRERAPEIRARARQIGMDR